MIRKGQARWVSDDEIRKQNKFVDQLFDLAASNLAAQLLSGRPPSPFSKLQHFPPSQRRPSLNAARPSTHV